MTDRDRLDQLLQLLAEEAGLDPSDDRALALLALEEGHPEVTRSLLSRAENVEDDEKGSK